MKKLRRSLTKLKRLRTSFLAIYVFCLVASMLPGAQYAEPATAHRVHPALLELAAEMPDQMVRVIVQAAAPLDGVLASLEELGARIDRRLPIINAAVAELPAATVYDLDQLPSIHWVSVDGLMRSANEGDEVVYTTWAASLMGSYNAIQEDFADPVEAGHYLWLSIIIEADDLPADASYIEIQNGVVEYPMGEDLHTYSIPEGRVFFIPGLAEASTIFNRDEQRWETRVPAHYDDEVFATGVPIHLVEGLPEELKDVTVKARFLWESEETEVEWQWAAAAYDHFPEDWNEAGIKSVDEDEAPSIYLNYDDAGSPQNIKAHLIAGGTGNGEDDYVGKYSSSQDAIRSIRGLEPMTGSVGPDGHYAPMDRTLEAVSGFSGQFIPGYEIGRVELVLNAYASTPLEDEVKIAISQAFWDDEVKLKEERFDAFVGQENSGEIVVDITDMRDWNWTLFAKNVTVQIDQSNFDPGQVVYYDGVGFRITAVPAGNDGGYEVSIPSSSYTSDINKDQLLNVYNEAIGATEAWNKVPRRLQGQGVNIAILDSGIGKNKDLGRRKFLDVNFNREYQTSEDTYGHGTFVSSIAAGDGKHSKGAFVGIAPKANVINVRVSDDYGSSTEAEVIEALNWVMINQDRYDIRAINLSLNASTLDSYHTSPLNAAVEMLWLSGVVVVVSAGNNGGPLYPPANDPFVITVGATDDQGTVDLQDDVVAHFSARGTDANGITKPDIVAPGTNIVAYLPKHKQLTMGKNHDKHALDNDYFRMSGTSMSAPMVTGAVALLLQNEPDLTPDQVKYRLMATANRDWAGYDPMTAGAGYLDVDAAIHTPTSEFANVGFPPSEFLRPVIAQALGQDAAWSSVNWNSVNWNSVNWNSVNWNSVNWNSVNWNSVNWNSGFTWSSVNWNSDYWDDSWAETQSVKERIMRGIPAEAPVMNNHLYLPGISNQ